MFLQAAALKEESLFKAVCILHTYNHHLASGYGVLPEMDVKIIL